MLDKSKLDELLKARREKIVNNLIMEYRSNSLTIEKANGYVGALSEISYWIKKDYNEIMEDSGK